MRLASFNYKDIFQLEKFIYIITHLLYNYITTIYPIDKYMKDWSLFNEKNIYL